MLASRPFQDRAGVRLGAVLALAGLYFLLARLGLSFGVVEQVTAVWPPSGLALAAAVLLGPWIWPGIWIGALAANLAANAPFGAALGIATGNSLEAVLGAWLMWRFNFSFTLGRLRDVLALMLLGATLATALAATIGVTSLCLGGVHPWSRFGELWFVWWFGDAMGALLVAPVLLTWSRWRRASWRWQRMVEGVVLGGGMLLVSWVVFNDTPASSGVHPFQYFLFPFVIWGAMRFGPRGTSLITLTICAIAIGCAMQGVGPFGIRDFEHGWVYLQAFTGVVAITGLMISAAISERDRTERHRAAEAAIARVLAEGGTLTHAAPRILEAICDCLDFDLGSLWTVDSAAGVLRCTQVWHWPELRVPAFTTLSLESTFPPGIGLPGRVWSSGEPLWIEDVAKDPNFLRAPAAAREGLHGAFGFPIVIESEILGVIEFYSREIRQPDDKLLQLMRSAGSQIGQFIERKAAEEAVAASEARKAGVLASVIDAIVTIDHRGRLVEFNRGAEQIFGFSASTVLGQELVTRIIPERMRETLRRGLARLVEGDKGALLDRRLEMPALRADGTEFPAELTLTRVAGAGPPLFTGYLRDITERKVSEEERAQLLAGERAARAQAESLAADLRQQQKAKDHFLAMLGHELRNPLAPVANALQVLRERNDTDLERRELHELMDRQVRHMMRLVDDLLDVSRIVSGRIELRRERLEMRDALERVVAANRTFAEDRRQRLTVSVPAIELWIEADPTRLMQIVSNLLNNAVRYTPNGGEIALGLTHEEGQVVLEVRDNGIGIKPELLLHVFELFVQGDRLPESVREGLGIGLTLVKTLVELHGGTITAQSEGPGLGSRFVVRLPLEPVDRYPLFAGLHADAAGNPRASTKAAARRVLVVDDNRDSAQTMAMMLAHVGHETEVAYDGLEALEKFRARRPDAVLLDIQLPRGLSGLDVARQIVQEVGSQGVLLIAMTGFGQSQDRQRSREAGFHHHMVKPVDALELMRLLESGMGTSS